MFNIIKVHNLGKHTQVNKDLWISKPLSCVWWLSASNSTSSGTHTASTWSCCYTQRAPESSAAILLVKDFEVNVKKIQTKVVFESSMGLYSCFGKPAREDKKERENGASGLGAPREAEKKSSKVKVRFLHITYRTTLHFGVTLTWQFPPPCFIAQSKTASLLSLHQQIGQRAKACIDNTLFMVAVNMRPLFNMWIYGCVWPLYLQAQHFLLTDICPHHE